MTSSSATGSESEDGISHEISLPVENSPTWKQHIETTSKHPFTAERWTCPECGVDVGKTAIIELVYTYEVCRCDFVDYPHLIQRAHHLNCFCQIGDR